MIANTFEGVVAVVYVSKSWRIEVKCWIRIQTAKTRTLLYLYPCCVEFRGLACPAAQHKH